MDLKHLLGLFLIKAIYVVVSGSHGELPGISFVKTGNFCHPNISFSYETEPVNNHCRKLPVILNAARLVIIPDLVSYHLV